MGEARRGVHRCAAAGAASGGVAAGTIWRDKPRKDIPGSVWLPDTGYGELAPAMEHYFAARLTQATGGDRDRAAGVLLPGGLLDVVECGETSVIAMGYSHVAWYPDGTDGWAADHLPLEAAPEPAAD